MMTFFLKYKEKIDLTILRKKRARKMRWMTLTVVVSVRLVLEKAISCPNHNVE